MKKATELSKVETKKLDRMIERGLATDDAIAFAERTIDRAIEAAGLIGDLDARRRTEALDQDRLVVVDRWHQISSISGGVYCVVELSFAVGATLYVRFDKLWGESILDDRDPDPSKHAAHYPHRVRCELTWSSTARSIEDAQRCVDLYSLLTRVGRQVEGAFANVVVVTVVRNERSAR